MENIWTTFIGEGQKETTLDTARAPYNYQGNSIQYKPSLHRHYYHHSRRYLPL